MTGWHGEQRPGGWDQPGGPAGYAQAPASEGGFGGPQRPSRLPAVLGVLAIIVIVGTVVTIILLNRSTSDPLSGPSTSSAPPATTTSAPPSSTTRRPTTSARPPTTTGSPGGGTTVDNTTARLAYRVPAGWQVDKSATVKVLGVDFSGSATADPYDCGGANYSRAFAVSAAIQSSTKQAIDPAKTANTFAAEFAEDFYPQGTVEGTPVIKEGQTDAKKSVTLTAKITTKPTKPDCEAATGEITIVAVDLANATPDRPSGIAMLAVVRDTTGGPADPAPVPDSAVASIVDSVKVR